MELRLSASGGLPSSLVTAAYFNVRLIPRDFVPQQSLRDGHFPTASDVGGFSIVSKARACSPYRCIYNMADFAICRMSLGVNSIKADKKIGNTGYYSLQTLFAMLFMQR